MRNVQLILVHVAIKYAMMVIDLLFRHCTLGFPVYPMGHEQLEAWPLDLQMALAPHGSTLHASRHVPSSHLSGSRQSRSVTQAAMGVTASTNK